MTSITKLKLNSNYHVPKKSASILTRSRSRLIGSRPGYWGDGSSTDSSWYENDGVVNTVSMYAPTTGENGGDPTIKYDKSDILIPGQWYWKKITDIDHWNITGHMCDNKKKEDINRLFQRTI